MGFFSNLQGSIGSFFVKEHLQRSKTPSATATGTVQGDAYPITTDVTRFTTVASGTGCVLNADIDNPVVINRGANTLLLYPESGSSIDAGATDAPVSVAVNGVTMLQRISSTVWETLL